jgi:vancomycin resistance protein YoaR
MTPAEAAQTLQTRFGPFLQAPLHFDYAGKSWQPAPAEIGLQSNLQDQITAAMRVGRGDAGAAAAAQPASLAQQRRDLPLHVSVDAGKLQAYLRGVAGAIDHPVQEGTLAINHRTGAVKATAGTAGRAALVDEAAAAGMRALKTLQPGVVAINTRTVEPQITGPRIDEIKRTVDAMLQGSLQLQFDKKTFRFSRATILSMLTITPAGSTSGQPPKAQLDQEKLATWVTQLAGKIDHDPYEPRVAWNDGNLQLMQDGSPGSHLDQSQTIARINAAIAGSVRTVDLPVAAVPPRATAANLSTLGIKELIATGRSDFSGSAAYRIANIKAGVNRMNGILVPPDGEFSFNDNVGDMDAAHGFVDGLAIVGNRTQKEPGGGICQVSTTLFRAAFWAGLPFTAWTPHRFRISWYEKYEPIGMDATIFTGTGPDLKFTNDTGHWILIEGIVDTAKTMVTFNIYGTQVPGRTVERIGPTISKRTPAPTQPVYVNDPQQPFGKTKQTDTARGGMTIKVWRVIKQNGVEVGRRLFLTKFQPWPNIFVKNPKTPLPHGAKLGS